MSFDQINKQELTELLREVVKEVVESHPLTDEEIKWVRLAIEVEAQRKAFRQAVIDKTLIGLLSAGALWAGTKIFEFVLAHWK